MNSKSDFLQDYTDKIKKGTIKAPKKVLTVYTRLEKERQDPDCEYYFDIDAGLRPIRFMESFCKLSKGALGAPLKLELFQKAFIMALYGWKSKATGLRRFREAILLLGRKNGKSTLAAGLSLYMLVADKEGSPEVDTVASKRDQAKIVFEEACHMQDQSKDIKKLLHKRKTDMYCEYNYGVMQPLASDSNTLDGLNPSFAVIDELHAIKDRNLYDVVKQGMSARRQPILLQITTASLDDKPGSIYEAQYTYASKVLAGEVKDEHLLAVMYELDDAKEVEDEELWIKANPGLGTIKRVDTLREFVEKAKADASFKPTVMAKDFNIKTSGHASWLTYEAAHNSATFTLEDVRDTYAIGGCDLSATTDLTCSTLICKKPEDEVLYVLQHYFIPEERVKTIEHMSSKEAPYRAWEKRGLLTICPGFRVDYHQVTEWYMKMRDEYQITMVWNGYDRALAGYWAEEMTAEFGQGVMEKIAQGPFTWSGPMKELGARLSAHELNYNDNPILTWCITNTAVKITGTGDNIQPIKQSSTRRIDGLVSLLNAYVCYTNHKQDFENLVG